MSHSEAVSDGDPSVTTVEGALEQLGGSTDPYTIKRLWSQGLAAATSPEARDQILAVAGARLSHVEVSDSGPVAIDRLWLRHLAREVVYRGPTLSDDLLATAQTVMREAVFMADPEIDEWERSLARGEPILDFVRRVPAVTASLRELGRIAQRLRAVGVTSLVDPKKTDALLSFNDVIARMPAAVPGVIGEWMRVGRDQLRTWAKSSRGPQELPALIRALVRETGDRLTSVHFAAGSGVTSGGWDGLVEADGASLFVPAGVSGWELSTKEAAQRKALSDFQSRVAKTPAEVRSTMTYVQVICAPWLKADEFRADAEALDGFASVRAYNIDDLVTWLEQAPATTVWLRELLGGPLAGLRTIESVWRNWLSSTTEPLDERIVLAGRQREVAEVVTRASAGPGVSTIGGDVRLEEILAFFGATGRQVDDLNPLSELIVVETEDAARRIFETAAPLTLLATTADFLSMLPPASPHRVFVAVPGGDRVDVSLSRVDSQAVAEHFRKGDLDFHEATDRGELARRSLLALRRLLAVQPELHRPEWAKSATIEVRRSMLLQAWNRNRSADQAAVERLVGTSYSDVEERLHLLSRAHEDPFAAIIDDRWQVASPTDAWLLLGTQVTPDDATRFAELAVDVLTDIDPVASLSDEDRWRVSIDQPVTPSYSSHLRRGVARTIAMFGSLDPRTDLGKSRSSTTLAREVVWRILSHANTDLTFATWTTVAPYLSLLVEAAPTTCVDALRAGLASDPPFMNLMFQDKEDGPLGSPRSSPHVQFLWALETLAWSPDYFADAVELMADLALIDPGGKWSNRPLSSLKSILCAWRPNTSATAEQQVQAVARLRTSHPAVAWEVLLSLLPNSRDIHLLQRGPEFRDWKQGAPVVLRSDYGTIVSAAAAALVEDAGVQVDRWVTLIDEIDNIPGDVQPALRDALRHLAALLQDDADRRRIWDALRSFTAKHREYADAQWALPETLLAEIDPLTALLEPADVRLRFGWLFAEGMVQLGDLRRRDDFDAYDGELSRRRAAAVKEIFDSGGLEAVLDFASSAAHPGQVGLALAQATETGASDDKLLALLPGDTDEATTSVAFAYFGQRFGQHGWPYLEALLDVESPLASARLLRSTWQPLEAAERADQLGDEVATAFWREFSYFRLGHDFDGAIEVARRLQSVGRHAAALKLLALYSRETDSLEFAEVIADGLEAFMEAGDSDPEAGTLKEYDFDLLLKFVAKHRDQIGRDRTVGLEWYFLPALGYDPDAQNLHRELAENPAFFVEMLKLIYIAASERDSERPPATEAKRRAAENAWRLLHSWGGGPGVTVDGSLDEAALVAWVHEARRLSEEADRVSVGDSEIGQALVGTPGDADGWPSAAVKTLSQNLRSDQIDSGFEMRIFNNRGVVTRALDAGGKAEWALAAEYRDKASENRSQWPRVARIFERLAETYEADARRADAEAERRRRGMS